MLGLPEVVRDISEISLAAMGSVWEAVRKDMALVGPLVPDLLEKTDVDVLNGMYRLCMPVV